VQEAKAPLQEAYATPQRVNASLQDIKATLPEFTSANSSAPESTLVTPSLPESTSAASRLTPRCGGQCSHQPIMAHHIFFRDRRCHHTRHLHVDCPYSHPAPIILSTCMIDSSEDPCNAFALQFLILWTKMLTFCVDVLPNCPIICYTLAVAAVT